MMNLITIHIIENESFVEMVKNVEKVNEVMKLQQRKWLKPYIDLNTQLRFKAEVKVQKNICKKMKSFWKICRRCEKKKKDGNCKNC